MVARVQRGVLLGLVLAALGCRGPQTFDDVPLIPPDMVGDVPGPDQEPPADRSETDVPDDGDVSDSAVFDAPVDPPDATVPDVSPDDVSEDVTTPDDVPEDVTTTDDVPEVYDATSDAPVADVPIADAPGTDGGTPRPLSPALIPERQVTCAGTVPPAAVVTAGAADRYVLRGRVVTPTTVLAPGEVLVSAGAIACVAASCAGRPGYEGATVIHTGGILYPGLVDLHNHVEYDFLPPWTPPRLFTRADQWQAIPEYRAFVAPQREGDAVVCQTTKWGELRGLVGGTTSIQGAPNRRCVTRTLIRNIEHTPDFGGADTIRTEVLGIGSVSVADAMSLRTAMDEGRVTAYFIHLSEGIDETARREFDLLVTRNLLTPATVVIHGTALGPPEFAQMARAGAKLVWSPRSNVILYGRTTDVGAALDAGVPVALAPDWTPSGGPDLLAELRYARYVSREALGGRLTSRDLVGMVTDRAAAMAGRNQIGALAEGRFADVLVVPDRGCDPYDSLIDTPTSDVRLVMVGGRPLYGDAALIAALPAAARARCEAVAFCGVDKQLCVAQESTADLLNQTYADLQRDLRARAMLMDGGTYPAPLPYPLVPFCPAP